MTDQGAGAIVLADTVGDLLPSQARALFSQVKNGAGEGAVLVTHMHNDLGLGLANTLAALESGVRVASSSWLGMAGRSGIVATAQLLFLLAYRPERTAQVLGTHCEPWWTVLTQLASGRVLRAVAQRLGYSLDQQQTRTALNWAKERAYRLNQATITDADFAAYLDGLTATCYRTGPTTDART